MMVDERLTAQKNNIVFSYMSLMSHSISNHADLCDTLPGKHDDAMRNLVLAQALPAASYQLLVFPRQLLHPPAGGNTRQVLLERKHTTPLQDKIDR